MMEIVEYEGVTQIRMSREMGGKALYWTAAYLIDGLLIDTGCSHTTEELLVYLGKYPPAMVVNTHYHEDHIGANRRIQERFGVSIYAHRDAAPLIGQPAKLFPYQELVWGYPEPSRVLPVPPVLRTDRYSFDVVEVPGHCRDHIALVEKSRGWCFSGDAVLGPNVKALRPEEDLAEILASLRKLAALDTERLVFFTSLGRIYPNGREVLEAFFSYIADLCAKMDNTSGAGRSLQDMVVHVFGGEDPMAAMTNGQFSRENLVREIMKLGTRFDITDRSV
jgi:glyoxylase-like metal-dependent hydrolase (beta-lactamase superfamily II)